MTSLRNRKSFSSPSLQALGTPPPIPTGKGSRSAADPAFSEYIENTRQIPELILPELVCGLVPAVIDYPLLLQGDYDSVNRLLRSAADLGRFHIIGHGICSEEFKSTLIENQWVFEELSQTNLHYADREELVWCHEIAEKAETILGDKNLHIFSQTMNEAARKLKEIAEELAPIIARGEIKQLKNSVQTRESTLVLHRYHQTTAITNQLPSIPTNESGQISSRYALRLHLLLEPGEFFSRAGGVSFSLFTRGNTIIVTVGDNFEGRNAGEFKNAIKNLKFKPEFQECGPLFSIELQWSSSDFSAFDLSNSAKKFTLADQILILILLLFLYKTWCFLFS